ncbi:HAD-IC family P-type ATPase [Carnobacterium maltaromaticum]|uniref:HAD-IC family P-type ATPase n=1 Tax=Carnobacterium maltaromaticum TaxID=2751 RepID=UPI00295EF563|nr:HAD-IC family P-type ATPase [Carnobacterium maltaromaticum]
MEKYYGLSNVQVDQLKKEGKQNLQPLSNSKSLKKILSDNLFTLFNAYNFIIAVALFSVKSYASLIFMIVVLINAGMSILQELRSKKMVAQLSIITSPKTIVLREGTKISLDNEDLVLGDLIFYEPGNQISTDAKLIEGSVEVDESLLTGESISVTKNTKDTLLSGSYIISGSCYAEVVHIGINNYATQLAFEAKQRTTAKSDLIIFFNKITKLLSFFTIPLGGLLIWQGLFLRNQPLDITIISTSTVLLGMLPKGLVLLTTLSLIGSVYKLGGKKALIQDLFSIETLSKIDTLCIDKTGTLTYGKMEVSGIYPIGDVSHSSLENLLGAVVTYSKDNNSTFQALQEHFKPEVETPYKFIQQVDFSSDRKWSSVTLKQIGSVIIGAPDIVAPHFDIKKHIGLIPNEQRILLIGHMKTAIDKNSKLTGIEPLGIISITDQIRQSVPETIDFFNTNGIDVKVISGDRPETVSAIALQAGIKHASSYIDASTLKNDSDLKKAILEYNVIGRATPSQKSKMVCYLKEKNRVAMTGDGVNDILALKDADCSIAMGSGSDAVRQISQIILLDSNLSSLIDVIKEGRLVVNNTIRSASMYYVKTIYTVGLAILVILGNLPFPFIPFQIMLLDMFVEGFPSFMISFEKNTKKPVDTIGSHVLKFSVPNALSIILSSVILYFYSLIQPLSLAEYSTILFVLISFLSLHLIYRIYRPLNRYRGCVLFINLIGFYLGITLFSPLLKLQPMTSRLFTILAAAIFVSILITYFFVFLIRKNLE